MVTQLAADLGVKVEFVPTSWDTLGAGIAADKYDICASGITMTLERLKSVAFSDPYLDSPLVPLILKKDEGKFASWRDMDKAGVKLAVMAGTSAEESAKKSFTKAEIVSITAPALDYQELLAGRVTAAITDTIFIKKALAQYREGLRGGGHRQADRGPADQHDDAAGRPGVAQLGQHLGRSQEAVRLLRQPVPEVDGGLRALS